MGFSDNGSYSLRQLDQLKTCLGAREKVSAERHATLSKRINKKHKQFKADWKAYSMWREEVESREKSRLRAKTGQDTN